MADRIRVGIIGNGFMGRTHARAYRWAREHAGLPIETTMIADARGERATNTPSGNLDLDGDNGGDAPSHGARLVTDAREVFNSDDVDLVSICTPTHTHVDLAIAALEAGKHVLVEKPVATTAAEVERLLGVADVAKVDRGLVCVPAMCMRHWPEWRWLKETIASGAHGLVRSASFTRLGAMPTWSGFYREPAQSGGAILDLHIHDVDFILHCFGMPRAVTSRGDADAVTTLYDIHNGPARVAASGGWLRSPSTPFTMRYLVEFEGGVADFDLSRTPALLWHGADAGEPETIDTPEGSGYDHQAVGVVRAVLGESEPLVSLRAALAGVRIVDAERASARGCCTVELG